MLKGTRRRLASLGVSDADSDETRDQKVALTGPGIAAIVMAERR
jgi:hypothetical protein